MARKIAAGNWKMNGTRAALAELAAIDAGLTPDSPETLICPPATLLAAASADRQTLKIGAQDCHTAAKGAHTGDLSAPMLADAGASHVILGHSERRQDHGETDAQIAAKLAAACAAGLTPILCLGETEAERDGGQALQIVGDQLAGALDGADLPADLVIAYEPVWAIGTGKVPTLDQINEVHDFLRTALNKRSDAATDIPLLYGGSVKAANAAEIFAAPNVDGALVGGASLTAQDFLPIVAALAAA